MSYHRRCVGVILIAISIGGRYLNGISWRSDRYHLSNNVRQWLNKNETRIGVDEAERRQKGKQKAMIRLPIKKDKGKSGALNHSTLPHLRRNRNSIALHPFLEF